MIRTFARALATTAVLLGTAACATTPAAVAPSNAGSTSASASQQAPATSAGPSTAATFQPATAGPGASGGAAAACIEKNAYDAYMQGPTSIETTSTPFVWDAFAFDISHYDDPATAAWRTQLATALQHRDVRTADTLGADLVDGTVKLVRCP